MKNDVSHSSYLQQDLLNLLKPDYFYQDLTDPDSSQMDFSINNITYPYINLHISFETRNEQQMDLSYFCSLCVKNNETWKEFDRTETNSRDHHNKFIKWTKFFTIAYAFQVKQQLKFCIYQNTSFKNLPENNDINIKSEIEITKDSYDDYLYINEYKQHELLGECEIPLSSIVLVSLSKEIRIPIKNNDQTVGHLIIKVDQVDHCSSIVNGQLICEKLKKSRWVTCNEPFFVISKKNATSTSSQNVISEPNFNSQISLSDSISAIPINNDFCPIYQSEMNKKMQFKPFSIPYQVLCNMDKDLPIRISFYNQRKYKKPKIIGYNDTTFSRLFSSIDQVLPVFHIENAAYIVGSFKIVSLSIQQKSNFYDYLQSGIKLNYITAIDFTSLLPSEKADSNGHQESMENGNYPLSSSPTAGDTNFNSIVINSNLLSFPQPPKKRVTRNSFMEAKPPQISAYHSSFSSSSSSPSEKVEPAISASNSCITCAANYEFKSPSRSLHERCIRSLGDILSCYSSNNCFPTLGFGLEIDGKLKHCIPLNMNPNNPCVRGVDGIVGALSESLDKSSFKRGSPTLFSPVIKYASRYAIQSFEKNRSYSILAVLTEGIINDMQDTIDALVDASRLPLSIIFVGFKSNKPSENLNNRIRSQMEVFNSFNERGAAQKESKQLVSRTGRKMERNVVKFVMFDEEKSDVWNTSEILKDVPGQLVEWTEMNGIKSYKA